MKICSDLFVFLILAVVCPKLATLTNGGIIPKSCSMKDIEHGIRCVYHCNSGYELRGPRYVTCNNTKWTEYAPVSCVRGMCTI